MFVVLACVVFVVHVGIVRVGVVHVFVMLACVVFEVHVGIVHVGVIACRCSPFFRKVFWV